MGLEDRFKITEPGPYGGNDLVGSQPFGSLLMEYARGNVTAGEAVTAFEFWIQTPLTAQETTDLSAVRTLIDAGTTESQRILIAQQVKDALVLGEKVTPGYTTRAELKSKIGF